MQDKVNDFIEDTKEIVEIADDVVDAAEEVVDAAEEVGKQAGNLFARVITNIYNGIIHIINFFKNLFKRKG